MTGASIYLKAENLQRSGAYKIRGATFKLSELPDEERLHGVIAASAGNHAQGVAIAAAALQAETATLRVGSPPLGASERQRSQRSVAVPR